MTITLKPYQQKAIDQKVRKGADSIRQAAILDTIKNMPKILLIGHIPNETPVKGNFKPVTTIIDHHV